MDFSGSINEGNQWTIKKRLVVMTVSLVVLTGIIIAGSTFYTASQSLDELTAHTLRMKLDSDINALHTFAGNRFGELSLDGDQLVDADRQALDGRSTVMDEFSDKHDVATTIFKRDGDDFTRIVTSIRKPGGQRAVGTQLGTGSKAYKPVMDRKLYIGRAEILGVPYITAYDPILDRQDKVIGIYFVGVRMDRVNAIIAQSRSSLLWNSTLILLGVVLAGILISWLFSNALNQTLNRIIGRLTQGAEQVQASSVQLSGASQELAESSSEQAASLEETTSSLEEMSSQIKQTAENSGLAESAMNETKPLVGNGVQAMERMTVAMDEIKESSLQTSKIIKTIDDIAFQTNLLALNAAVEAARAGEAGKGFAVVAEEVRNLAQRSAEAAKNTSELIQQSQESSEKGSGVASEVSEYLKQIEESVLNVSTLVVEISAASKEQATGIQEMSTVMSQMDNVVQGNASASEESAGSAEELSSQATELQGVIQELQALVGRAKAAYSAGSQEQSSVYQEKAKASFRPANGQGGKESKRRQSSGKVAARSVSAAHDDEARELIPFDEDDFSGF